MFFDDTCEVVSIAKKTGTAIFVVPDSCEIKIPNAIILEPEGKATITIEQVRNLLLKLNLKQTDDLFVLIRPAELMNPEATNALLKTLEEPREKVHFMLVTSRPSMLIPTVVSRSAVYILKRDWRVDASIEADAKVKGLAKELLVARNVDLVGLAEKITKKRDNVRQYVLDILSVAVEMAYKSYFLTHKTVFLDKTTKLIEAYENIAKNGHIKLHLVADLC
ncbi:hypothetical protein IKD98_04210 [Candidatus Saccharibacteria bacterium]|nr:hypothetical protein [Candidatus Saccharibacteria bacterium]